MILLLLTPTRAIGEKELTYEDLAGISDEQILMMVKENPKAILPILRRTAARADGEIAARIPPTRQIEMSRRILEVIGQLSGDPADLRFLQSFFLNVENTLNGISEIPALRVIIELKDGLPLAEKQRMLRGIANDAMDGYALTAHRLGMDEAAVPALLQKLDGSHLDIAMGASRALGNLQSSRLVKEMEMRLRADEAHFPRGPYDPKFLEDAQEHGTRDTRFGKAGDYYAVLTKMKTAEARTAAAATLDRWEAIYRDHPQRDEYLTYMHIANAREELARTAGEVAVQEPDRPESTRQGAATTAPSGSILPRAAPAPVAALAESPTPSSAFLWTGAVVTLALLVSLLVFWKRRA